MTAGQIAEAVRAKHVGTEHVLLAMLFDRGTLASRILEFTGFSYEDKEQGPKISDLRNSAVLPSLRVAIKMVSPTAISVSCP